LKKVKPYKCSGIDLIPAELLQTSGGAATRDESVLSALNKQELQEQLKIPIFVVVYKAGECVT
jgi:hypothetical protein